MVIFGVCPACQIYKHNAGGAWRVRGPIRLRLGWPPSEMGKNDHKRSPQISPEEEDIRWALAYGKINQEQFEAGMEILRKQGKLYLRPRYKLQKGTDD